VPEIGLGEERDDAGDDAEDVGGAAVVEDPGELERREADQLQDRADFPEPPGGCNLGSTRQRSGQPRSAGDEGGRRGRERGRTFGGGDDVVAEEVGEHLAELDLEVRGARLGAVGLRGGRGGRDERAELVDVGRHCAAIAAAAATGTGAGAGAGAGAGGSEGSAAAGPRWPSPSLFSLLNFERQWRGRVGDRFQVCSPPFSACPTLRHSHAWAQLGRKVGPIHNSETWVLFPSKMCLSFYLKK